MHAFIISLIYCHITTHVCISYSCLTHFVILQGRYDPNFMHVKMSIWGYGGLSKVSEPGSKWCLPVSKASNFLSQCCYFAVCHGHSYLTPGSLSQNSWWWWNDSGLLWELNKRCLTTTVMPANRRCSVHTCSKQSAFPASEGADPGLWRCTRGGSYPVLPAGCAPENMDDRNGYSTWQPHFHSRATGPVSLNTQPRSFQEHQVFLRPPQCKFRCE